MKSDFLNMNEAKEYFKTIKNNIINIKKDLAENGITIEPIQVPKPKSAIHMLNIISDLNIAYFKLKIKLEQVKKEENAEKLKKKIPHKKLENYKHGQRVGRYKTVVENTETGEKKYFNSFMDCALALNLTYTTVRHAVLQEKTKGDLKFYRIDKLKNDDYQIEIFLFGDYLKTVSYLEFLKIFNFTEKEANKMLNYKANYKGYRAKKKGSNITINYNYFNKDYMQLKAILPNGEVRTYKNAIEMNKDIKIPFYAISSCLRKARNGWRKHKIKSLRKSTFEI